MIWRRQPLSVAANRDKGRHRLALLTRRPDLRRTARLAAAAAFVLVPASASGQLPSMSDQPFTPIPRPPSIDPMMVSLGARLFNDPNLSGDGRRSCASCHDLRTNGASADRFDTTQDHKPLWMNTPTVFNAALSFRLDWTGDVRTLEQQANESLRSPDLMRAQPGPVLQRLEREPSMNERFRAVFGHRPDWNSLLDAIAAFECTLLTPGSRFDLFLAGDPGALGPKELAGYEMFKSIGCVACHQGVGIGGNLYERQGVVNPEGVPSHALFRVPSLRNVATTPPYFHDGSAPTLQDAVRKMAAAQLGRALSDSDVSAITAFLGTLTGRYRGHEIAVPR